jgi:tRNA(Ile)-lysidine synthase TilS/MesJ
MHVGFAISGGVDSMALACMYMRARTANPTLPPAYGFIVDHKARPESTEEAIWVKEELFFKCELNQHDLRIFLHTENIQSEWGVRF